MKFSLLINMKMPKIVGIFIFIGREMFMLRYYMFRKKFVCVEVLRPSQPNGVMSSAVSLPNHTFTGQA